MSGEECVACRRPKATLNCGICEEPLCRPCSQFLPEGSFSFLEVIPPELVHNDYCPTCFDAHVVPARTSYDGFMSHANETAVFFTTQKRALPILKKALRWIEVDCADRDEAILRLAFRAAEQSFNSLIEVEVTCSKVRNFGYQKSAWHGKGRPADVDVAKVERWAGNKENLRLGQKIR